MTDEQLQRISGLFAGVQLSLVHLANVLDSRGVISREELAASFLDSAGQVPTQANNRDVIALVLAQVAQGIRGSNLPGSPEPPEKPQQVYLRLIRGGQADRPE